MKNLSINKKQKEKLLEMCKALFPNSKPNFYSKHRIGLWTLCEDSSVEAEYLCKIHWFEFCFTHLAERVIKYNPKGFEYLAYCTMLKTTNPIDYLYEQFKKIKQ